jgi:repressor LexA
MMGITPRQQDCLDALRAFRDRFRRMPTLEELGAELGIGSRSAVSAHLKRLEQRGYLKRIPGAARAIKLSKSKCPHCGGELAGRK